MTGVYPTVFGEIARICESVRPESVRVLWWDTKVRGDQEFKPDQYHEIAQLMKPKGGGGTTVSCVAQYVAQKEYKPAAVIYLTDGYIESQYDTVDAPCLWGVVDNERFMPLVGQKVNINSLTI
jgi:predicted metal-dependent peptidase